MQGGVVCAASFDWHDSMACTQKVQQCSRQRQRASTARAACQWHNQPIRTADELLDASRPHPCGVKPGEAQIVFFSCPRKSSGRALVLVLAPGLAILGADKTESSTNPGPTFGTDQHLANISGRHIFGASSWCVTPSPSYTFPTHNDLTPPSSPSYYRVAHFYPNPLPVQVGQEIF